MVGHTFLRPISCALLICVLLPATGCQQETSLVVVNSTDVSTLDPFSMFSRVEISLADHIVQTLTFLDRDMQVVPQLATEWRRLDDDLTWEFTLRSDVLFHNGEQFTADAVKFSLDEMLQRNREGKTLGPATVAAPSAEIVSVEVVDGYTVRISTAGPKALLPFYLTQIYMVAPGFYASASDPERAETTVGTGPYTIAERIRDSHITLARNDAYWGDPAKTERITFRVIPEISTQIAELETGGAHIVPNLPFDQARILRDHGDIRLVSVPGGRRVMIGITTDGGNPALADKRVRQALNYAIDFDAINQGLLGGLATRMGPVFNAPFTNPEVEPYPYDHDKARALLTEAGYPNGLVLNSLDTPVGKWIQDYELAQAVASQLETVGVTLQDGVRTFEWGNYRSRLLRYDLPDLFMQASGGEFELLTEAADLSITSPSNFYRWRNDDYEKLWSELQNELDGERRLQIGYRMQEIIHDAAPWIFLYIQQDLYGVSDRVDWEPRMDEIVHLWDVSLAE